MYSLDLVSNFFFFPNLLLARFLKIHHCSALFCANFHSAAWINYIICTGPDEPLKSDSRQPFDHTAHEFLHCIDRIQLIEPQQHQSITPETAPDERKFRYSAKSSSHMTTRAQSIRFVAWLASALVPGTTEYCKQGLLSAAKNDRSRCA